MWYVPTRYNNCYCNVYKYMIMFMQLELVHPLVCHPGHVLTMYSSFLLKNFQTKCIHNYFKKKFFFVSLTFEFISSSETLLSAIEKLLSHI